MLDTCLRSETPGASTYAGPERRATATPPLARWLALMLDEMDHGMLLVTPHGRLRHANEPARHELAGAERLLLADGTVRAAQPRQCAELAHALAEASRGRRHLVWVGQPERHLSVAVVPLPDDRQGGEPLVLLVLGRRPQADTLTLDFYARTQGLTDAEARVLRALCSGLGPKQVANEFDVAVSTVRTQISSIRHKTRTTSIRDLIGRIATLPPITMTMRSMLSH